MLTLLFLSGIIIHHIVSCLKTNSVLYVSLRGIYPPVYPVLYYICKYFWRQKIMKHAFVYVFYVLCEWCFIGKVRLCVIVLRVFERIIISVLEFIICHSIICCDWWANNNIYFIQINDSLTLKTPKDYRLTHPLLILINWIKIIRKMIILINENHVINATVNWALFEIVISCL